MSHKVFGECLICAHDIDGVEKLPCLVACGHNSVCSLCFLRLRSLQRNMSCPSCKQELENVISINPAAESKKNFGDFEVWGDSIGSDYILDAKSNMFFPVQFHRKKVLPLWQYRCKICSTTRRDMKALRSHVSAEHNMQICSHCVEHKQVFPAEQTVYTQERYEKHLRHGDGDGSQGHPYCEFCKSRFYDSTALFIHLNKDHYNCHLCAKRGVQFKYYKNYNTLEAHFRRDHILCEDPGCLARKFVAFDNEIEFSAHNAKWHPQLTANFNRRPIPVQFKVGGRSRGGRGAVGGADGDDGEEGTEELERVLKLSAEEANSAAANGGGGGARDNGNSGRRGGGFEGGMGGREEGGEWQVLLAPSNARDPRTTGGQIDESLLPAQAIHQGLVGAGAGTSVGAGESSLSEDFPSLPPPPSTTSAGAGAGSDIRISNRWMSVGGSTGSARISNTSNNRKKHHYPALPHSSVKSSGGIGNSGSGGGGGGGGRQNDTLSDIQREYQGLGAVVTPTDVEQQYAAPAPTTGSLCDFLRVKPGKKGSSSGGGGGGGGATVPKELSESSTGAVGATEIRHAPALTEADFSPAPFTQSSSTPQAAAGGGSAVADQTQGKQQQQQQQQQGAGYGPALTVGWTAVRGGGGGAGAATQRSLNFNDPTHYPSLSAAVPPTSSGAGAGAGAGAPSMVKSTVTKKKAKKGSTGAGAGGWGDALKAVGMQQPSTKGASKKSKLSVAKTSKSSDNIADISGNKVDTGTRSGGSGALGLSVVQPRLGVAGWPSSGATAAAAANIGGGVATVGRMTAIGKASEASAAGDYLAYRAASSGGGGGKRHGGWVKIGGTGGEHAQQEALYLSTAAGAAGAGAAGTGAAGRTSSDYPPLGKGVSK